MSEVENRPAETLLQEALDLFDKGLFSESSNLFSQLLKIKSEECGEEDPSLARFFHLYGQSLLYEAKANSDFFGDTAHQQMRENEELMEEDEEEEDLGNDEIEKLIKQQDEKEKGENVKKEGENVKEGESIKEEEVETVKIEDVKKGESVENGDHVKVEVENSKEGEEEDEEEEEPSQEVEPHQEDDLEMAWEMLEVARNLASKEPVQKALLSNIYISLGELHLENELIEESIAEYKKSIELREELEDLRGQAEGHFLISLSYEAMNKTDEAIDALQRAKKLLIIDTESKSGTEKNSGAKEEVEAMIKDIDDKIACIQEVFTEAETDPFGSMNIGSLINSALAKVNAEMEPNVLIPRRKVGSSEREEEENGSEDMKSSNKKQKTTEKEAENN